MSDIGPGDVVVCVNASLIERPLYFARGDWLVKGRLYRVADVGFDEDDGAPTIRLAGLGEYLAERFRKIDAPKSELSEIIRACKPIRQRERA